MEMIFKAVGRDKNTLGREEGQSGNNSNFFHRDDSKKKWSIIILFFKVGRRRIGKSQVR